LFTADDIKSIVCPETAFGIIAALSGSLLTTNANPTLLEASSRLPNVIIWNWLNVFLFNISNQRLPQSVLEDSINKPWRPLPSGRISETQARRLLLAVVPVVFLVSCVLGGMIETVAMIVLGYMYNDLRGGDENYNIRNFINSLGFMCYSSGSAKVAVGFGKHELNERATSWILIVGAMVFTTLSMQDMPDIPGDTIRGRRTLPLIHGEKFARWAIALPVIFWSFICPSFWELEGMTYFFSVALGGVLAVRVLVFRSVDADATSWRLWCVWTISLYALPLCKNYQVLIDFREAVRR
jgi:4-hydroxybenzoate polyprenyltransferase